MDKDKIIKLIRLANNNPNDNEANLAARKACKLLGAAEKEFLAGPVRTAADKMNEHASNYSGFPNWMRYASRAQREYYDAPYDDFLRKNKERRAEQERAARKARDEERVRQQHAKEEQAKREAENQKHYTSKDYDTFWTDESKFVYDTIYNEAEKSFSTDGGKTWKSTREYHAEPPRQKASFVRECAKCSLRVSTYSRANPFICGICSVAAKPG
jgi:SNF2 family DNA or RNA helicase